MSSRIANWIGQRLRGTPRKYEIYGSLSVAETFQKIYRTKAWGDGGQPFHSGSGSRGSVAEEYCDAVIKFIQKQKIGSVVDLGCGDFSVGRTIAEATGVCYTGIDVVPELIEHHRSAIHDSRISFQCADITTGPLPAADLCLIRQVLQHLSNEEIAKVLAHLGCFSRVLISEHLPLHPRSMNRDKTHGPDVRARYGSGVYLEEPPFSVPVEEMWNFPLDKNSMLRTVLLRQTAPVTSEAVA